jgi:hypothetical protein
VGIFPDNLAILVSTHDILFILITVTTYLLLVKLS